MGDPREAYLERFKTKLDEWNSKIDQLQVQAKGAHDEALVSYNKQIEALKAKRDGLKGEMAELHTRGEAAWVDLREGLGTAWKVLGDSIDNAKSKLK
jgi:uncharacterized coiled-coil DUF342 family protein